jgi:antitoxin component YwqK of YwqJK toxin-antitoxin module
MEISNAYDKNHSMKHLTVLLTIVFISLISSPSWSETIGNLVKRNDLYYKKFTNVPFTGEISEEKYKGHFKDGLKNGSWQYYTESEQLEREESWKDGVREGRWAFYRKDGSLERSGNVKNDKQEGTWEQYSKDGQLSSLENYKNGAKHGVWKYFLQGKLWALITYKDGVEHGLYEEYDMSTYKLIVTKTFKNGKLVE